MTNSLPWSFDGYDQSKINQRSIMINPQSSNIYNHLLLFLFSNHQQSWVKISATSGSMFIRHSTINHPSPYKANDSRVHRSGVAEAADSQKSSKVHHGYENIIKYLWSIINCKTDIHGYPSYLHHGLCFTICWTRDFPWDEISGIPIAYDGHWTLEDRQHVELLPSRHGRRQVELKWMKTLGPFFR